MFRIGLKRYLALKIFPFRVSDFGIHCDPAEGDSRLKGELKSQGLFPSYLARTKPALQGLESRLGIEMSGLRVQGSVGLFRSSLKQHMALWVAGFKV